MDVQSEVCLSEWGVSQTFSHINMCLCVWACSGSRQMESCLSTWHMQCYHCLHPWLISVICNQLCISILLQIKNILGGKEGQNTCVQVREWEAYIKRICFWKHCLYMWLLLQYTSATVKKNFLEPQLLSYKLQFGSLLKEVAWVLYVPGVWLAVRGWLTKLHLCYMLLKSSLSKGLSGFSKCNCHQRKMPYWYLIFFLTLFVSIVVGKVVST